MAALDRHANSAVLQSGLAAASDRLPSATVDPAAQFSAPATDAPNGGGPGRAPAVTGIFARREKRRAEADRRRRVERAVQPDGAGDLSFFLQLRQPGDADAAAEPDDDADSDADISADSSADASLGGTGTLQQPQVQDIVAPNPALTPSSLIPCSVLA